MSELRIGDADRDAAVAALGEHYAAGRLTKEEYDERADRAWAARTGSALHPLFADLPRPEVAPPVTRGRPDRGWWTGARMAPVLLVVLLLVVLTGHPFLLLFLGWFVFARMAGHWSRTNGHRRGLSRRG